MNMRQPLIQPYGDLVAYEDFASEEVPSLDPALMKAFVDSMNATMDTPLMAYLESSWMNRMIWDYFMAHSRVIYKGPSDHA